MPSITVGSTKSQILKAARKLLGRGGGQEFTMRELATEVGISAAGLYRHYRSREEIIATLAAQELRRVDESLHRAAKTGRWRGNLEAMIARYLDHAFGAPELFDAMVGTHMNGFAERSEFRGAAALLFAHVRAVLAQPLGGRVVEDGAYEIVAATHGVVALTSPANRRRAKRNQKEIATRLVAAVMSGRVNSRTN